MRDQLHHRGVQLIFIAHRRGATFEITYGRSFFRNDQCALKLAGLRGIDAEISRQLHRTAHTLGDVAKGAIAKHRRIECRKKVIGVGHHRAQVFLHQLRMILHCFGKRTENDPQLAQLCFERRRDRDTVEHRIDGDAGEQIPVRRRGNAELLVGLEQLRVDLFQTLGSDPSLVSAPNSSGSPGSRSADNAPSPTSARPADFSSLAQCR